MPIKKRFHGKPLASRGPIRQTLAVSAALFFLLAAGCSAQRQGRVEPRRLIVMSAMRSELAALVSRAEIAETRVINGRSYYVGRLFGKNVVLVLCGISMVNASMTAQTALDHFPAAGIVLSGIAGGVNPGLNIGDVVVPAKWGEYQEQVFARETADGWRTNVGNPEFGHYGMMMPGRVSVTHRGGKPDAQESLFWFAVSPEMLAAAREAAGSVPLSDRTASGGHLSHRPAVVVGGNGVSGPTFVDNAAYREWVWRTFHADALDMESAAVAHVAYVNGVPFIAFRSISDLAGGGPGENEVNTFLSLASENSAAVLLAFLARWPEEQTRATESPRSR
jgi:adenosylhomocysteine nucleosidase